MKIIKQKNMDNRENITYQLESLINDWKEENYKLDEMIDDWETSNDPTCDPGLQAEQELKVDDRWNRLVNYIKEMF